MIEAKYGTGHIKEWMEMEVDRRSEGLTKEGFRRKSELILSKEEYAIFTGIASVFNGAEKGPRFPVVVPLYQPDPDRIRVIKTGDFKLFDSIFSSAREDLKHLKEMSEPKDVISRVLWLVIGAKFEELMPKISAMGYSLDEWQRRLQKISQDLETL